MNFSRTIDLYCERTDPSFWAEPVNAITNVAFVIAAALAYSDWRRAGARDTPVLLLIVLTAAVGTGSFVFHTMATTGAELFDTVPIAVFIYAYLLLALRRFLALGWVWALVLLAGFAGINFVEAASIPSDTFNGSHEYLPALTALTAVGLAAWRRPSGPWLLVAAALFVVSLAFRSADNALCTLLPLGTHFLWHCLNAAVIYLLLRAALNDPGGKPQPP